RINYIVRPVGVGEPLAESDSSGVGCQSRHFGENGGAEPVEPAAGGLHASSIKAHTNSSSLYDEHVTIQNDARRGALPWLLIIGGAIGLVASFALAYEDFQLALKGED